MDIVFSTTAATLAPRIITAQADVLPVTCPPIVQASARAARFAGKAGEIVDCLVPAGEPAGAAASGFARLIVLGLGPADAADYAQALEKAGAALVARYLAAGEADLVLDLAGSGLDAAQVARLLLGMRLRAWRWDAYRSDLPADQRPTLRTITVIGAPDGADVAWQDAQAVAQGVEFTRELVTEPGNVIYPESFVARCEARYAGTGLDLRVLDEADMRDMGMGALLGVAQGSARPPRLLMITWNGADAGQAPLALVGKGVTFDTGGISIKPAAGMEDMKWDMGGAGAVAGTMLALALRKARAHVVGICALVENMPDGNAQRPGDVVRSMSGKTIEVINTDAEGRLVLCDALTFVQAECKPAAIVDLATLTGAIIGALAQEYAGLFSTHDALAGEILAAGDAVAEWLWRMPMGKAYDRMIDSQIADMKNLGGKFAGAITAAQFLARFIENGTPWAHLDIAGMVWAEQAGHTWAAGATGYGVRLLDQLVRNGEGRA